KFINETHKENEKYKSLFGNMKKYSIDESDVHPWLVPKYGALFFVVCCFEASFSATKITDYLYIKDTFATFVNQYQEAESSNSVDVEPIRNSNTFSRQNETLPGIPESSKNKNCESSYKNNYDEYIKYSKLLGESSPNSSFYYFYQYMVDILSDAIVQDIITNPANSQSNFEPQLISPTINLDSLVNKADSKDDENTTRYDWAELDKMFWPQKPRRKQFLQTKNSVTLSESAQGNVKDEGFLFGEYGIVDAFFTSTVFRIVNYSLPCENEFAKKYVETTKNQSWLKNGSSWQLKRTVIMNQTRNPSFKHLSFIIKQMLLISLDCLLNKVNFATFLDKVCKRIEL
ncbi:hypothetical protein BB558_003044, partial [Smittium angustum]